MPIRQFKGETWTVQDIENFWEVIDSIGKDWGITYPKTQIEILSSDQMVETIATIGTPCSYDHWSIGKRAVHLHNDYAHGKSGLALELIINSDPTIMYIAENNTLIQQGLVLAHAGIGHGSVFKHNHLFKRWTHATSILDYLTFAKNYIKDCEIKHSPGAVEWMLDRCHALQDYGISHHKRLRIKDYKDRQASLVKESQSIDLNILNASYKADISGRINKLNKALDTEEAIYQFPEENILYFLEKNSPVLSKWQREVIRINRKIAEYFYPQRKTKILHEGWATFIEQQVFNELFNRGHIDEGGYMEFLRDHSNVIYQPAYNSPYYSGSINPYAIGFHIFNDLYRMTIKPTSADWKAYPELCETDWKESLMEIVKNYTDEDFISRYLTSGVIDKFKLFIPKVDLDASEITIEGTSFDEGAIREVLAASLNMHSYQPMLQIEEYNTDFDEALRIGVINYKDRVYDEQALRELGRYIYELWGSKVIMDKSRV